MSRAANYSIQGYLYQFNKTLLEILGAHEDAVVTVEGVAEDIEVDYEGVTIGIQCKYHESKANYSPSTIYKPLLQMMWHFKGNSEGQFRYVLFIHFSNSSGSNVVVDKSTLQQALSSQDVSLKDYVNGLDGCVDLEVFLEYFRIEVGPSLEQLIDDVHEKLSEYEVGDVDILGYPNAIQLIASLAIKKDATLRKISKSQLLTRLREIKATAISRWTLELINRRKLLDARRRQLKVNLNKNSRLRYFVLHGESLNDFEDRVAKFIRSYVEKYHFKVVHKKTPIFCLSTPEDLFHRIERRLHDLGVEANTGEVGRCFDAKRFFKEPVIDARAGAIIKREFSIRLLQWNSHWSILNTEKCDDLFVLGAGGYERLDTLDINVEELATRSFPDIEYMLGLCDAYE